MKRILIYCVIVAGVLTIPVRRLDVGDLIPVQTVWLYRENDRIVLETDTKDKGTGTTLEEALENLEENCIGIIYLDTAEFLLVSENAVDQLMPIKAFLKGSVKVCRWDQSAGVEEAGKYMAAHKIGLPLRQCREDKEPPILKIEKIN